MGNNGAGMSFRGEGTQLQTPATEQQATDQYGNVTQGLLQQQNFVNAVQAQHGLQNQSNVFNQQMGVANGTGPNPAQAMLANSTGQNVANQAALMAGQRGSGQNAGLLARQAGMAGANIQQQAAGQGAALQANQSLNALNQAGGIANQQANQQANATNAYNQNALGAQSNTLGAIGANNNARVGMQSNINSANAGLAQVVAKQQGDLLGKVTGAAGTAIAGLMASGGMVPHAYAEGGEITGMQASGPQSSVGRAFMQQQQDLGAPSLQTPVPMPQMDLDPAADPAQPKAPPPAPATSNTMGTPPVDMMDLTGAMGSTMAAKGGAVPALVSPGETYLNPDKVSQVAKGANPLKVGEKIPGTPKVKGNSYSNDTVPKTLEAGGIVIPNSIMQHKDAEKKAAEFVAAVLRKHRGGR